MQLPGQQSIYGERQNGLHNKVCMQTHTSSFLTPKIKSLTWVVCLNSTSEYPPHLLADYCPVHDIMKERNRNWRNSVEIIQQQQTTVRRTLTQSCHIAEKVS